MEYSTSSESLKDTLSNNRFKSMLNMAKNNWTQFPIEKVITSIMMFLSSLETVGV